MVLNNKDEMAEQNVRVRTNFSEIYKYTEELIALRKQRRSNSINIPIFK